MTSNQTDGRQTAWSRLPLIVLVVVCAVLVDGAKARPINVLVANRGAGSFSVIDSVTKSVTTHALPSPVGVLAEPMYISHSPFNDLVYIGDRANERLVIYDADDYSTHLGFVPVGAGIFHQWGNSAHNQLWVNNDIDDTISVVDMLSSSVITTIPIPADLTSGKPHDVILDPNSDAAFVTILGVNGPDDFVLKYSTTTFAETGRLAVGKDPHVAPSALNDTLYVPTQDGVVHVIDRSTFTESDTIAVPNSHGAFVSADAATFFTTNIADGGTGGLVSISAATNIINSSTDTPFSVPHNIRLSPDQTELFLTHSGATNDKVTIWDITDPANPVFSTSVTTGLNPYGIEVIAPEPGSAHMLLLASIAFGAMLRSRRHRSA